MQEKTFKYHLSGFIFETNIFFPELESAKINSTCSIRVKQNISSTIPKEALTLASYHNEELGLKCINLKKLGFVSIWNNKEIEYSPLRDLNQAQLRMIILGSISMIMATTLGYISFHAATIIINNKAVLICANSGIGKSSTAAYFYSKGYPILSDDVINIKISEKGEVKAFPSVPRIKLNEEGLKQIGKSSEGLDIIPTINKKYSLPIFQTLLKPNYTISRVVFLQFSSEEKTFEEIKGSRKINELSKHLHLKRNGNLLNYTAQKNKVLFRMAAKLDMYFYKRVNKKESINDSLKYLEKKLLEM